MCERQKPRNIGKNLQNAKNVEKMRTQIERCITKWQRNACGVVWYGVVWREFILHYMWKIRCQRCLFMNIKMCNSMKMSPIFNGNPSGMSSFVYRSIFLRCFHKHSQSVSGEVQDTRNLYSEYNWMIYDVFVSAFFSFSF